MNYNKTSLPELVSVKTLISIFRRTIDHVVPPDVHDFFEICYVEHGMARVLLDGEPVVVSEGELIIYAPNSVHAGSDLKERKAVILNNVCFDGNVELLHKYTNRPLTLTGAQKKHLLEIVERGSVHFEREYGVGGMIRKPGTSEYELKRLKNELELFLVSVIEMFESEMNTAPSNRKNHNAECFSTLNEYLTKKISENPTSEDMAKSLSVSVSTLKRICRDGCGMSPTAYFIHLKMERARELIDKSAMNVTEIAEALGYSSVHYFSKLFKDKVGMAPTEYAKNNIISHQK